MSNKIHEITVYYGAKSTVPDIFFDIGQQQMFSIAGLIFEFDQVTIDRSGNYCDGTIRFEVHSNECDMFDDFHHYNAQLVVCFNEQYVLCDSGIIGAHGGAHGITKIRTIHLEPFPF